MKNIKSIDQKGPALKVIREEDDKAILTPLKPENVKQTMEIIRKATSVPSGYIKSRKHDFF